MWRWSPGRDPAHGARSGLTLILRGDAPAGPLGLAVDKVVAELDEIEFAGFHHFLELFVTAAVRGGNTDIADVAGQPVQPDILDRHHWFHGQSTIVAEIVTLIVG